MKPDWTNTDGSFSRYSKAELKIEAIRKLRQRMVETLGRRFLGVMGLCSHMAVVAEVVVA